MREALKRETNNSLIPNHDPQLSYVFTIGEDYIKPVSQHISMDLCQLQSRVHLPKIFAPPKICSRDQIWHKMTIPAAQAAKWHTNNVTLNSDASSAESARLQNS